RRMLGGRAASRSSGESSPLQDLAAAVSAANQQIFAIGQASAANGEVRPLGTTIVALRIVQDRAYWAHVGDSRLYRVRQDRLQLLTAAHTMHGEPYRSQTDVPLDLAHTNTLLQALGIGAEINISTASDAVLPGDVYLLCSDGVHALVPADVIR